MPHRQMLTEVFTSNLDMLRKELSDFSDADMMHRPVPRANHALWQLGHLAASEAHLVGSSVPGSMPPLPQDFQQKFSYDMTGCDDAGKFGLRKQELLDLFGKIRQGSIAWIQTATLEDLDKPTPQPLQKLVPTLGHLAMLLLSHVNMHLGQIQVIRRALNKPVLF